MLQAVERKRTEKSEYRSIIIAAGRESEIERKIEINEKRQYKNVNGVNTRIED